MSKTTPLLAQTPQLDAAVEAGLLGQVQPAIVRPAAPLLGFTLEWNLINILYCAGGALLVLAAVMFSALVVDTFGNKGLLGVSLFYALLSFGVAMYLQSVALFIPAMIFALIPTIMVPVAVNVVCELSGHKHTEIAVRSLVWLTAITTGLFVLGHFSFPFMVMPVVAGAFAFGLDVIPEVCKDVINADKAHLYSWIALVLAMLTLAAGFIVNFLVAKTVADFTFWLFLAGGVTFEWALFDLTLGHGFKELAGEHWQTVFKTLALVFNIALLIIGAGMGQPWMATMGGIGSFMGVTDLIYSNMTGRWVTTTVIALAGLMLMGLGIMLSRSAEIAAFLEFILPSAAVLAASFTLVATVAAAAGALYLFYLKRFKPKELTE